MLTRFREKAKVIIAVFETGMYIAQILQNILDGAIIKIGKIQLI